MQSTASLDGRSVWMLNVTGNLLSAFGIKLQASSELKSLISFSNSLLHIALSLPQFLTF
jgi:hypothetical protein